jgi:heme exporter protein D
MFGSAFVVGVGVLVLLSVLGVSAFASALALVGILAGLLGVLLGVERWRAMRTGRLGDGRLERFFDHQMTEKVDESSAVLLDAVFRAPELAESMAEMLGDTAERVFTPRKRRNLERMSEAIRPDLVPEEKTLAVVQATRVPHGAKRALMWLTFGIAMVALMKTGILTVTDRRLLFHSYRRKKARLLTADPLADVSVVDWFNGLGVSERFHSVLILRRADGSTARFQIHRFWRKEGRTAFELIASVSNDPPSALANYWRSELGNAARRASVAASS